MINLRQSIKNFITVVAFLVLIVIVAVSYDNNELNQSKLEDSIFYQKASLLLNTIWGSAQGLAGWNLERNLGAGDDLFSQIEKEAVKSEMIEDGRAWSALFSRIQEEWQRGADGCSNGEGVQIIKLEKGRQILIPYNCDQSYKLNLPF
jgi:hypothetical protein